MDNKKIGNFISERRKYLELTQQQLADRLGVSNKAISKWETGEGYPEITTIPDLCNILSISADEFFAGRILGVPTDENYTGGVGNNNSSYNNKENCIDNNFIKIAKVESKSLEFLQKEIRFVAPYLFSLVISYYILPMFWNEFIESDYIFLSAFLTVCVVCSIHYTIKHGFSLILSIGTGILFLPTMLLYMDGRDKDAIMYSVLYCIVALFVSFITLFLKKRYSVSISIATMSKIENIH